jgi:hypothetical protein
LLRLATKDRIVMSTCLCAFVMWTSCCHGVLVCKECYNECTECCDNKVRGESRENQRTLFDGTNF